MSLGNIQSDLSDLPEGAPLQLVPRLETYAQWVSGRLKIPYGTVVFVLMTLLHGQSARSIGLDVERVWSMIPLRALLFGGGEGGLATLADWMGEAVRIMREQILDAPRIAEGDRIARLDSLHKAYRKKKDANECADLEFFHWSRYYDRHVAVRLLERPPDFAAVDFAFGFSPSLICYDGTIAGWANRDPSGGQWRSLLAGAKCMDGETRPYSALLSVDRIQLRDYLAADMDASTPGALVLPLAGGKLFRTEASHEDAIEGWCYLCETAIAQWGQPRVDVAPNAHAQRLIDRLERETSRIDLTYRKRISSTWAVPTFINLALADHQMRGGGPEVADVSWDNAHALTLWALEAHKRCLRYVPQPKRYPPDRDDVFRARNYLLAHPQAKYRDLMRAMPKRERGYWLMQMKRAEFSINSDNAKILHNKSRYVVPEATRPTNPTSDKAWGPKTAAEIMREQFSDQLFGFAPPPGATRQTTDKSS